MNREDIVDSENRPLRDDRYYLIRDICSGDESVASLEKFIEMNSTEASQALRSLVSDPLLSKQEKLMLLANSWRILNKVRPPTIEEFMTDSWIGPTADSLYPHIKKMLSEFYAKDSTYRHLVLGSGIRVGKSTASVIASLYSLVNFWCKRDAKKLYGVAQSGSFTYGLISFTKDKAAQLLLQPFINILVSAPRFKRIRMEEKLSIEQHDNPDRICWTTSSRVGSLQFFGDLHYIVMSDPANLLGLNMVQAILSEISFFIDKGFSPDYIWRIYQDSKNRVFGTFNNKRYTGTIIDSSPNDIKASPIDSYIFSGEAERDPLNYVFTGSYWQYLPQKCPIWNKDRTKTFPVFRGSSEKPPKVLTADEVSSYPEGEIYNVPIDLYRLFNENCQKNVKDYCGWPSGQAGLLMKDKKIVDNIFVEGLRNVYTYIYAPASKNPVGLIWNIVKDQFFVEYDRGYEFWRDPNEKRYLHADQSESGDVAAISMVHPEFDDEKNEIIPVVDFTLPICPEKERINLDAIRFFIEDLINLGHIRLEKVTFDQYQSAPTLQHFNRNGIPCGRLSVDANVTPYQSLISYINEGNLKCGRNVLFKNNLLSLREVKSPQSGHVKIDHTQGKIVYQDGGSWEHSQMGSFAKDVSDSVCGAVWNCMHEFSGVPLMRWRQDQMLTVEESRRARKDRVLQKLLNEYGVDMTGIDDV